MCDEDKTILSANKPSKPVRDDLISTKSQYTEQDKQCSLSTSYVYSPLSSPDKYRVVQIEPSNYGEDVWFSLREYDESSDGGYRAISYVWESTELTHVIHSLKGSIRVTTNLYNALQHYRDPNESFWFWADAICIRQDDPEEKASQVLLIGHIFSQSRHVLVWLGEESTTDKEAFEAIARISDGCWSGVEQLLTGPAYQAFYNRLENELDSGTVARSLTTLLDRSWFSRTWTYQEAHVAKFLILSCGSLDMDFEHLKRLGMIFFEFSGFPYLGSLSAVPNLSQLTRLYTRDLHEAADDQRTQFVELLSVCRFRKCSVLHDKIYGFLGLIDPATILPYAPQYTIPFDRLYTDFAMHIIKHAQDLEIWKTCIFSETEDSVPSWAPNWGVPNGSTNYLQPRPGALYRATNDQKVQITPSEVPTELVVAGIFVGELRCLSEAFGSDKYEYSSIQDDFELGTRFGVQHDTIQKCFALASRATRYPNGESPADAWYRTIMAIRQFGSERSESDFLHTVQRYTQLLADIASRGIRGIDNLPQPEVISEVEHNFLLVIENRKFCLTQDGAMGWVPQAAQEADIVSIIFGSSTPVLLRPKGKSFLMLGQCYIHGIMNGEAMTEENLARVQQISLL